MWRTLLLSMALVATLAQAAGVAADVAVDPALEARVNQLAAELRCLVCQNQSLADSHAGLALQLKDQVREQLRSGRSEQQVVAYMTARYGDFVLYRPPLKATTALLWAGPVLLVAIGIALLGRALRRPPQSAALSEADAARAAAMLERGSITPQAIALTEAPNRMRCSVANAPQAQDTKRKSRSPCA